MAELKILSNYIYLKRPTFIYENEKSFWVQPTEFVCPIHIMKGRVEYKELHIQKKVVCGFEQFEAKHSLILFLITGKDIEIQFEDEDAYKVALERLEHEFLF